MKNIFAISGSAASISSNATFLKTVKKALTEEYSITIFEHLRALPLFSPDLLGVPLPETVLQFKESLKGAEAVIICTPEYNHNIPAVLKNALEWTSDSGEFFQKSVLPITFTPHAPRGEWAMQSLISTLKSLEARVPVQLSLYKNDFKWKDQMPILEEGDLDYLREAFSLL
jgi:chromate reductase